MAEFTSQNANSDVILQSEIQHTIAPLMSSYFQYIPSVTLKKKKLPHSKIAPFPRAIEKKEKKRNEKKAEKSNWIPFFPFFSLQRTDTLDATPRCINAPSSLGRTPFHAVFSRAQISLTRWRRKTESIRHSSMTSSKLSDISSLPPPPLPPPPFHSASPSPAGWDSSP